MFEIEKNVPRARVYRNGRTKYPFVDMEAGDSFVIDSSDVDSLAKIRSAAVSYGRANKKKFSTLRQADGNYRCWRIA